MNKINILNHTVIWFLREGECDLLYSTWECDIKKFIIDSYLEGEFSVEFEDNMDSLIWRIER